MFRFHKKYFLWAIALFLIEVFIAAFVRDKFIRPFVGDFLSVIFLYCFFRSFLNISVKTACILVLSIAFGLEILQYFNIVEILGLENNRILSILLGSVFDVLDLIIYTLGIITVLYLEGVWPKRQTIKSSN